MKAEQALFVRFKYYPFFNLFFTTSYQRINIHLLEYKYSLIRE